MSPSLRLPNCCSCCTCKLSIVQMSAVRGVGACSSSVERRIATQLVSESAGTGAIGKKQKVLYEL